MAYDNHISSFQYSGIVEWWKGGENMKIVEKRFRGSIICRVLGYPISYGIVKLLFENGKMELSEIAKHVERSKQATCSQLTKLRLVNMVRYETKGNTTTYWIKYPKETEQLLNACEVIVQRISQRLDKDY
jgi:hypothetical protein